MLKVTKHYKIYFSVSALLIILSVAALFAWGLRPGIDFRGGALAEIEFAEEADPNMIREIIFAQGVGDVIIQAVDEKTVIVKTRVINQQERDKIQQALKETFGDFTEHRFESIGPTIGRELKTGAYWQIGLVILGIILYISYSFRKISKVSKEVKLSSWKLGVATIIALVHDLLITIGVFAVLGRFLSVEIDTLFVTAMLTILGFSVHDTIVVFDRIRENLKRFKYLSFAENIDFSVDSTLARSINTTSTLIFVLLALLLFGGDTIYYFVLALLVGVSAGVYSSVFIASPLLNVWHKSN